MASKKRTSPIIVLIVAAINTSACAGNSRGGESATVVIDNSKTHQVIEGFGAAHIPLVDDTGDHLSAELRRQAVDAVYGQVRLNTGNIEVGVLEAPSNSASPWEAQANDDNDPFHFNWNGFNFKGSDAAKTKLIDLAKPLGFDDFYLALRVSVRFANLWMKALRTRDYNRYLDECGEQIAAGMIHWRESDGTVPRYVQLFNEPTSGNRELDPGSIQEIIDIIKRVGQRLREEGFADVKFVVPNEETVERSLNVARAVLSDPQARQYVGAIGYHSYPYGSIYSDVKRILATSGRAEPNRNEIRVRTELRDLGRQYGIPLWMTEVSHGNVPALSFEDLIGRAIHIHDELTYADASAYFGMQNFSHTGLLHGQPFDPYTNEGNIAIVDLQKNRVFITGMGYAIGHYARWVSRGSLRVDATSSEPLIQVTAFRDEVKKRLVIILINNSVRAMDANLRFKGLGNYNRLTFEGEVSTVKAAWAPLPAFSTDAGSASSLRLPEKSVTTIAARF